MDEQNVIQNKTRPIFLTIICIASFAGVGYSIFKSLMAFYRMITGYGSVAMIFSKFSFLHISNIISALLCLLGVLLMFNLKKSGFTFYLIGEIIPMITPVFFFGYGFQYDLFYVVSGFLISCAFIVMYSINLKHLS